MTQMNANEKSPGKWKASWPGLRAAWPRLLLIVCVLFPLSWAINAVLIGSWRVTVGGAESLRHFVEWMVILAAAVGAAFWVSLLPKFARLFGPRAVRRMFIALAWLVTLAVLLYAEEDWRGRRAWSALRQPIEARGESLDFKSYIPSPIPDEQNFAATPLVKSWFSLANLAPGRQWCDRDSYSLLATNVVSAANQPTRQFLDLAAWKAAFEALRAGVYKPDQQFKSGQLDPESRARAVPAVREGLQSIEPLLAELRSASRRSSCRYPIFYNLEDPWGILLPHLRSLRAACQRLQLEACAELAAGRSDQALADVKLMLYLGDSLKSEPTLISYLVRIACFQLAIQPVWEGLAEHRWSEAQLRELQARLQQYDFVSDMKWPLNAERAAGVLTCDLIRKKGLGYLVAIGGPGPATSWDTKLANAAGAVIPNGWYSREQFNYCRLNQLLLDSAYDVNQKRILPAQLRTNREALDREIRDWRWGHNFLRHKAIATLLLQTLDKIPRRAAAVQVAADEAALACALERYRLANERYPDTLEALVPQFIASVPKDVISGEPYKYRRADNGRFVLYSVGWNEKDDGGAPGKTLFDEANGDWAWQP